jgi:hypothetical protein
MSTAGSARFGVRRIEVRIGAGTTECAAASGVRAGFVTARGSGQPGEVRGRRPGGHRGRRRPPGQCSGAVPAAWSTDSLASGDPLRQAFRQAGKCPFSGDRPRPDRPGRFPGSDVVTPPRDRGDAPSEGLADNRPDKVIGQRCSSAPWRHRTNHDRHTARRTCAAYRADNTTGCTTQRASRVHGKVHFAAGFHVRGLPTGRDVRPSNATSKLAYTARCTFVAYLPNNAIDCATQGESRLRDLPIKQGDSAERPSQLAEKIASCTYAVANQAKRSAEWRSHLATEPRRPKPVESPEFEPAHPGRARSG